MNPNQLRDSYLKFFERQGHAIIPSAPIVPENDPTTLFTGSGMQPMVPYLLGEKHPQGTRVVDSQRCLRSQDIEDVGDNRHTTFFEMLGNWSLGDYFKKEQLRWYFTFLTQELKFDPWRLYVTVFAGSPEINIPRDDESVTIWKELFKEVGIEAVDVTDAETQEMNGGRIFYYPDAKNWWSRAGVPSNMPVGEPGGPDSEMFYDFGEELKLHENSEFKDQLCHVNCDCGRFMEIGNSVFMEYQKTESGFEKLPQKNVDFGGGFERKLAALNNDPDVFKTALFAPIIKKLEALSGLIYESEEVKRSFRVIADHMRSAVMLAVDEVYPGNKEQGYFSRRMLRRAVRYGKMIGIEKPFLGELVPEVVKIYEEPYPQIKERAAQVLEAVVSEEAKFRKTLDKGLKEVEKLLAAQGSITGADAFKLYETYGFPFEITQELAKEKGIQLSQADFDEARKSHADQSRTASVGKFKGGLADHSEQVTKYHTATHLLNQALRDVLGSHVQQAGSNITGERLRFDFTHPNGLMDEQLTKIEAIVNAQIKNDLSVSFVEMETDQAVKSGVVGVFGERYGDRVKVYSMGDFSKEICGGPHVEHTGVLGTFKLGKEKAIGAGKRRIYGYLK